MTKRDRATDSALTSAGATTAAVGVVAGGVPGAKGNVSGVAALRDNKKSEASRTKRAVKGVKPVVQAGKGGILGLRVSSHKAGTYGFKQKATLGEWYPSDVAREAYAQGRHRGKVAPEEKIIRHMSGSKKAAGAAILGGSALAAYGHERGKIKKNQSKRDRVNGALVGGGAAGLALSGTAGSLLRGQERRWADSAHKNEKTAARLVPGLGGKSDKELIKTPEVLDGVGPRRANRAGQLRGAAGQARHFSEVYRRTGKVVRAHRLPSAAVAAIGAGGLAVSQKKEKVKKSQRIMSDAEIKRRKKIQGKTSRATSTLGLAGVGIGTAALLASKKPNALKKIPVLRHKSSEQLKEAGLYTSLASGGIGGVGGYNFAAYTNAESRKRVPTAVPPKKKIKKSADMSAFGVVHNPYTALTAHRD